MLVSVGISSVIFLIFVMFLRMLLYVKDSKDRGK